MWTYSNQGLNPTPLHWKHGALSTAPPGKPLTFGKGVKTIIEEEKSVCVKNAVGTTSYPHAKSLLDPYSHYSKLTQKS